MNNNTQLSKWWKTKSCRDAYKRAEQKRKEHNAKSLARLLEKKARLKKEIEEMFA